MAPKNDKETKTDEKDLPKWDGKAATEKYCAICQGMVNGNGCAAEVCPVRPN